MTDSPVPPAPYDVVVFSIIDWDFRFQRPQQLARQFGRHGHRVFFLSVKFLPPGAPAWEMASKDLRVAELRLSARKQVDIYRELLTAAETEYVAETFAALAEQLGLGRVLAIVQLPFWTTLALRLRQRLGWHVMYDCMDDWARFRGIGDAVLAKEEHLVREADLTVVSSRLLEEKWRSLARRLVLVPNGIDLDHYQLHYVENDLLDSASRPVIGYFGALASWVDVSLLEAIASRFPHALLVLAGGHFDVDLSGLAALPNVRLLGQRPYDEMPKLLWHFDVCIIPFLINELTEATNPVKLFEYLFSGKPIVAPHLTELVPLEHLCYLAKDRDQLLAQLELALAEPEKDPRRAARQKVAAQSDWRKRYAIIDRLAREVLKAHEKELEAQATSAREREQSLLQEVQRLQTEAERWQQSRVWKAANVYWRGRRFLRRLLGRPLPLGPETTGPAHTAAEEGSVRRVSAPVVRRNAFDIVCFPMIDWHFRFQRPQQLATRLAAAGHRVFYIAQDFRAGGPPFELRPLTQNVFEASLRGPRRTVYRHELDESERERLWQSLDALRRELGLGATVSLVHLPYWWPLAKQAWQRWAWPVVYDCMDHHAGFTDSYPPWLARLEEELVAEARLVTASSAALYAKTERQNTSVLLLRNACDYEHFSQVGTRPHEGQRVVGYYGAIAAWFDTDLLAELAERRPLWRFLLVGSTCGADLSRLRKLGNVELVGEQTYRALPYWLDRMDVLLFPFHRTALTEATNPVKVYEILAAGKPVVSVPLPELAAMQPLVRLAETAEEFEAAIDAALQEADPDAVNKRRAFARRETWESRTEALTPRLREAFPRVSVVVVTFNNQKLSRLCLGSLYRETCWPNLEVLVVDNGSTDGTAKWLREAQAEYPGLVAILNPENRGFPAANNQALARATGEYLVLLNNDTVVTRGWLAALVRHLLADPSLGLVGPVTNAIGNEALVPTGYRDLADLPAWAERYCREHDGELFDIPMLAMFCVAMRRSLFETVGPLDERFGMGMFEDDDYSLRVREAGCRVVCARDAFVHHWMKASFGRLSEQEYDALVRRNRELYEKKWGMQWVPHKGPRGAS